MKNIVTSHIIDLDADPRIPYLGWKVEEHKKGGQFIWNPERVKLFLHEKQKGGNNIIEGNELRKELADTPVFNANLMNFLLDNPDLVPDEWKTDEMGNPLHIYFWGTIYRSADSVPCVQFLFFAYDGSAVRCFTYLGHYIGGKETAAIAQ